MLSDATPPTSTPAATASASKAGSHGSAKTATSLAHLGLREAAGLPADHLAQRGSMKIGMASRYQTVEGCPKAQLNETGLDASVAYRLVHDELVLDGNPTQNLASFVTTHMEPEALQLYNETLNKNLADGEEYPQTIELQNRCAKILANLWNASPSQSPVGTATIGSSEAIMLGGLAMKFRWREARKKEGKDTSKPNIVFGHNCQSALEKFSTYFDVATRYVDVSESSHFCNDPNEAIKLVDENTIGVIMIMGSTYTGHFEDVKLMATLLDKLQEETGLNVPIHVDGASGGMVAPFIFPDLEWDFRISRVVSINTSGHKYGLVLPGLGWIVWRDEQFLPKELVFNMAYLGGNVSSFTLNFSRNASNVILQYYQFVRLGAGGYKAIMSGCLEVAKILSLALEKSGMFRVYSDIHKDQVGLPVVAFGFTPELKKKGVSEYKLEHDLRRYGWIVPAYPLPHPLNGTTIVRVVVRESASMDLMDLLFRNMVQVAESLVEEAEVLHAAERKAFVGKKWQAVVKKVKESAEEKTHYPRVC
ncbi:glutamate decarboxylase [Gonapodya prolifera JEL478]|uniref:Glutamate decarboxylase n=1 Tax=Gonapodya prolifera (strain JEL478) TaxID=1344416 RepID=A0A139AJM2_GONPJ|nr:glutamate decarboxylase [Gonapodya prolifera JEL478]|eukprot:KXS17000.1 glutamate decarboxylase [Gonapodya prolifera JEL478]